MNLVGHAHDGDAKLRSALLRINRLRGIEHRGQVLEIAHAIIQLCLPNVADGDKPMFILAVMDWLHIGWRLRRQYLEGKRRLTFGGMLISHSKIVNLMQKLGLNESDVDPQDKQSWIGMLKVFDFVLGKQQAGVHGETISGKHPEKVVHEVAHVREALQKDDGHYANYLYIEFCHRYLRMFVIKDRTPMEVVKDAAFCILFIGFWHRDIGVQSNDLKVGSVMRRATDSELSSLRRNTRTRRSKSSSNPTIGLGPQPSIVKAGRVKVVKASQAARRTVRKDIANMTNMITRETSQDVLSSCMMMILAVKLFREHYNTVKFEPSRMSSRFSEYVFQLLRSVTKTSNKVDAAQFTHIIRAYFVGLDTQTSTDLPAMKSKRGQPHSLERCASWNSQPADYYPTDVLILGGIKEVSPSIVLYTVVYAAL